MHKIFVFLCHAYEGTPGTLSRHLTCIISPRPRVMTRADFSEVDSNEVLTTKHRIISLIALKSGIFKCCPCGCPN